MLFWRKYKAIFYDDKGNYAGIKGFNRKEKSMDYGKGTYNIDLNCSYFDRKAFFHDKRYYYYSLNNPNPVLMNKKAEPILNSESYNIMLKTKVLRDLNELSKGSGLGDLLTPRNIIIGLAIIGIIIYFATGNKITGAS